MIKYRKSGKEVIVMTSYITGRSDRALASLRPGKVEYGFFIACDDRSILKCVNAMLLHSGMVGLSDTEGKIHYLIDGRRGSNYVLGQVKDHVLPLREATPADSVYEDAIIYRAIDKVIERYGFMQTLSGTRILRSLLYHLYRKPGLLKCVSKSLYPLAQSEFKISVSQVERNLRYAIKKSPKLKQETRVIMVLRKLLDATMDEVMKHYGR